MALSGRGRAADIELSTAFLSFSLTVVGTSENRALTIRNRGDAPLSVTQIDSNDDAFSASPQQLRVLPRREADVTITFRPTADRGYEGRFRIASNDPDEPQLALRVVGSGI